MSERIKQTLNSILEVFKSGQIPEAISYAAFPPFNIPSVKWSYLNHILMWINGTNDARGFRQWKEVGRYVKRESNAFYILGPRLKKVEGSEDDKILIGFLGIPVFKVEDTDGEPLDYQRTEIHQFPLIDKAKAWGLNVMAVSGNGYFWGAYTGSDIKLATAEESVFFHELSHHAHKLIIGQLKPGQDWKQEIVAELSAEALCRIVGMKQETTGNSYRYIEHYAKDAGLMPVVACLQVLSDVEQVLKLILEKETSNEKTKEAGLLASV